MNKRKVTTDSNARPKAPIGRPSTNSLNGKTNTMKQRTTRPERSPSTQNLPRGEQKQAPNNVVETSMPKTRFNSHDRCKEFASFSSPRLKYFPVEKMKRIESAPPFTPDPIGAIIVQQNPQERGIMYVAGSSDQNCGQGDTTTLQSELSHQQHQNMHTVSQQQVAPHHSIHQVGQMNPNSESTLHQQVPINQAHRPCVPHGQREQSPQKNPQSMYRNPSQNVANLQASEHMQQSPRSLMNPEKYRPENNSAECPDYDRQPVGGRSALMYRQAVLNAQQPGVQSQISTIPNLSNLSTNQHHQPPNHNQYPRHAAQQSPNVNPQTLQQLQHTMAQQQQMRQQMQQRQQTMVQQQQMQQRAASAYQMQMNNKQQIPTNQGNFYRPSSTQYGVPGQGMTSLQDATTNHARNTQMMGRIQQNYQTPQRNFDYAMNSQSATHLKPYTVNVVNSPQQFVQQNQQLMTQYQQRPVQFYRKPDQQLYRTPAENVNQNQQMVYHQPGFNQQSIPNQQQTAQPYQQPIPNQHQTAQPYQQPIPNQHQTAQPHHQPPVENNEPNERNKTCLSFTAAMIRDQEKLIATMRQQGVPVDIIKRQFDGLLNEQRRHLEYIEDLRRQDEEQEVTRPVVVSRRRKQIDEKPDWMIHLTPPRRSYMELEKAHQEQKEKERLAKIQEARQLQQQQDEMSNQIPAYNQQQYQYYRQPNIQQVTGPPHQRTFAPPGANPGKYNTLASVRSTPNMPTMNYQYYRQPQGGPNYQQIPYAHQQNPQFQQYQQVYQDMPQQSQSQVHPNTPASENFRPSAEPSSLLKLRVYKDHIRPQGRNNGLQDPAVVKKYLEEKKTSTEFQRGLEYLHNLTPKKPPVRLNGIQDNSEVEAELQHQLYTPSYQPQPKRTSANGLENTRNPNNPPPQRLIRLTKHEPEFQREYPRQLQGNARNCYSVPAERENGTMAANEQTFYGQQQYPGYTSTPMIPYNETNPTTSRGNVLPFRYDGNNHSQHYQQMQQYYQNMRNLTRNNGQGDVSGSTQKTAVPSNPGFDRAGGDASGYADGQTAECKMPLYRMHYSQPDLHEARTIGGVRYLARKQDCMPNTQLVSPETLIASKHLQPPVIY